MARPSSPAVLLAFGLFAASVMAAPEPEPKVLESGVSAQRRIELRQSVGPVRTVGKVSAPAPAGGTSFQLGDAERARLRQTLREQSLAGPAGSR